MIPYTDAQRVGSGSAWWDRQATIPNLAQLATIRRLLAVMAVSPVASFVRYYEPSDSLPLAWEPMTAEEEEALSVAAESWSQHELF